MKLFARLFRLVWGGDVDRALRPVLAVSLVGSIAGSSAYPFMGIWAVKELGAPQGTLAFAYLVGAVLAGLTGYVGGHWSDKIGRRPLILAGWGFQAFVPLALIAVGHHVYVGLGLLALLPVFGSLGGAADQAMVADLVAPERHEAAYASVRVASNLGVTIGPPIGGLLLVGGQWAHLWLGTLVLAAAGFAIAYRYIPRSGPSGA
jgi:predicted MFS family arabinose efflux permease